MASFGDALRGYASVLNPQVAQQVAQEDAQNRALQNQLGMALVQNKLRQQDPAYQAQVEALKNDQAFRLAVSGAGGDMGKIAQAAVQYGKPELAINLYNQQEARTARLQEAAQNLDFKKTQLEQMHEQAMARITDSQQRQAETMRHNRAMEGLNAQNAALNAEIKRQGLVLQGIGVQLQKESLDLKKTQGNIKPPSGYRFGPDGSTLEAIPGGPADKLPPEQAGKAAMTKQAILDVDRAEKLLFDENGDLRRGVIAASKAPFGGIGEDPRLVNTYVRNAVSAKYRLETGAAGNQAEVDDIMARFMPNLLDTKKTAKDKLNRLREFMNMSLSDMKGAGMISPQTYKSAGGGEPSLDDLLNKYGK